MEIRERRVARAMLVAFILLIASNPLGRLIVGEDRYDQGAEVMLAANGATKSASSADERGRGWVRKSAWT